MRGKREMRKNYTPFAAGMVTMILLFGLVSASLAEKNARKVELSSCQMGRVMVI